MNENNEKKPEKKSQHFSRNEIGFIIFTCVLNVLALFVYSELIFWSRLVDIVLFLYVLDKAYNQKSS